MIEDFETRAARYVMEWGEWIEKLRLLAELEIDIKNLDIYIKKLLDLQNPDGGFPKKWIKGNNSGIIETATALELLSKLKIKNENTQKAIEHLLRKQLINGSWREEEYIKGKTPRTNLLTAKVTRALLAYNIKGEKIRKAIEFLVRGQRDDGFWLTSLNETAEIDLEATNEAALTLLELEDEYLNKIAKLGIDAIWKWFMEKITEEWSEPPKEALIITEALIRAGFGEAEAVRRVLQSYVKTERWRFGDKRSISTKEAIKVLEELLLANAIDKEKIRREIERLIFIKSKLKELIENYENDVRNYFLIRFEEIGIKPKDPQEKILLGCFLYSMMDQFFWTSEDFDPQVEYRGIVGLIGGVHEISKYKEFENVREAFFRSRALRGIARRRKIEVARGISLFAEFLLKYGPFKSFNDFAIKLRAYILFEVAPKISGWDTSYNLGKLLRLFAKAENSTDKLMESVILSLECLPAVGTKIATLFPYHAFWIFEIWPEVKKYVKCPIDWNIVKPYGMLELSCMTLKELRRDPKRASSAIYKLAEELFPNDPAKISFLWIVGHEWCTKPYRCYGLAGKKCWIFEICTRGRRYERKKNLE